MTNKKSIRNKVIQLFNTSNKENDIEICMDKETHRPVILKEQDRLYHTLIVGQTGCNKQKAFLPLITQDIQKNNCGITVIEPMEAFAQKVVEIAEKNKRTYKYFNPTDIDSCFINPLKGEDYVVTERLSMFFNTIYKSKELHQYFQDCNDATLRNAILIIKALDKPNTNLMMLEKFLNDHQYASELINEFKKIKNIDNAEANNSKNNCSFEFEELTAIEADESCDLIDDDLFEFERLMDSESTRHNEQMIVNYFEKEYFSEDKKEFNRISALRDILTEINSNQYLGRVLNPKDGDICIDFCEHLLSNDVLIISTANGKLMNNRLSSIIMLMFQEAAFLRRRQQERFNPHYLYIDNFHNYNNRDFVELLRQGTYYNVACHLGVQSIAQLGSEDSLDNQMLAYIHNTIVFSQIDEETNDYFSQAFNLDEDLNTLPFNEIKYQIVKDRLIQSSKNGYLIPND